MNFAKKPKDPITHTTSPVIIGSSVIGIKYKDGIVIGSDCRLNYGESLCVAVDIGDRIQRLTDRFLIGYSGEISDAQETIRILKAKILSDSLISGNNSYLGPVELTNYLSNLHYYQRNQMNPYLNSVITGGIDWEGKVVLMSIDPFGTLLEANYFFTNVANYFCNSIILPEYPQNPQEMTKEKALDLLNKCFEVLFYRHSLAGNLIKFATMEKKGNEIVYEEKKYELQTKWDYEQFRNMANEKYYLTA